MDTNNYLLAGQTQKLTPITALLENRMIEILAIEEFQKINQPNLGICLLHSKSQGDSA